MVAEDEATSAIEHPVTHRMVATNGIQMHIAEQGSGPLVLLCHGFPELWYSWHHQMRALAEAGYHAVAPDQRGYGQTDQPEAVAAYTLFHLVGDLVGLLDALGEAQAVIVGHDWGAPVAWHAALLRPDRFRAVAGMSVPYAMRGALAGPKVQLPPTQAMRRVFGEHFYQLRMQKPGVIEAEMERDVRATMLGAFYGLSGDAAPAQRWNPLASADDFAAHAPATLPPWLSEDELNVYVETFQRTGFRGGLNWYRNLDRNWELAAAYSRAQIALPALYFQGDQDPTYTVPGGPERVRGMRATVPNVRMHILEGCGHWVQQERAAQVSAELIAWLREL